MPIKVTGNRGLDDAAAEIAIALRDARPGMRDQAYYDEAMRLRDEIMKGTRQLDAPGSLAVHFSADEIEALIITAADAVNGERHDLSRRQIELAMRAWRFMGRGV